MTTYYIVYYHDELDPDAKERDNTSGIVSNGICEDMTQAEAVLKLWQTHSTSPADSYMILEVKLTKKQLAEAKKFMEYGSY